MAKNYHQEHILKDLTKVDKTYDLIHRVKYTNTLPDVPFDLKLIQCQSKLKDYIKCNPTHVEKFHQYEVMVPYDLGVAIDLIDTDTYLIDPSAELAPEDERLLEDENYTPRDQERSEHHGKKVSWLRRSEYISTEKTRFIPKSQEKLASKIGYKLRKKLLEKPIAIDRATQIEAIEETFARSKIPITRHFRKPNITPVEILPVFPDFTNWGYPFAQGMFDSDPAPSGKNRHASMEVMSNAMVHAVVDDDEQHFVAYFLPTQKTLIKRKRDHHKIIPHGEDDQYEYNFEREYNWNVMKAAPKGYEDSYFFIIRNRGVYYNMFHTRVRLTKRRQKISHLNGGKVRLMIRHRPITKAELRMQRDRLKQLEPLQETDEDDTDDFEDNDDDDDDTDDFEDNDDEDDAVNIDHFNIVDDDEEVDTPTNCLTYTENYDSDNEYE